MAIRIACAVAGFRRAGVAHRREPTVYPDGFFSDDQIKQLQKEPRLAVELGDFEVEGPAPADPSADQAGAVEPDGTSDDLTGHLDGVVEPDGTQKSLEELPEDEVRQIAKDMKIAGWHNTGLEKLIEKINAEQIQVPAEGEA